MDKKELETWLETTEGQAWAEEFKSGLVNKNSELLDGLHKSNADMADLGRRLSAAESDLEAERAFISGQLIDRELEALLNNRHFFKTIIPHCIERLKNGYAMTVKADGTNRLPVGVIKDAEGNENQLSLTECFEHWYKLPETLDLTPPRNTGGGAQGSGSFSMSNQLPMSGQELARLTDAEFETMRQQTMRGNA